MSTVNATPELHRKDDELRIESSGTPSIRSAFPVQTGSRYGTSCDSSAAGRAAHRQVDMSTTNATQNFAERMMIGALMYYTPVLIFLGTIGNCLSVCVLHRTDMKRSSSSFYLAALAVSDTALLLSLIVPWLEFFDVHVFDRMTLCKFIIYFPTLCSFLSVWFVVGFTFERFIAVRFPLRRQAMCTAARAKATIVALTCLGPVLCAPILWMAVPIDWVWNVPTCDVDDEWETSAFVFNIFDTAVNFVLPFTVIAVLNGLIVITVWSQADVRGTLTNGAMLRDDEKTSGQQGASVAQTKITKMLLTVSTVFLGLNLPSYSMRVYAFNQSEELSRTNNLILHFCDLVYNTSFGINFFLYCASGQDFRQAVWDMIRCRPIRRSATNVSLSNRSSRLGTSTKSTTPSGRCLMSQHSMVIRIPLDAGCESRDL